MVINVTSDADLKMYTDAPQFCLLAFHQLASGPCRMMNPILDEFSRAFPAIKSYKVDIDELYEAADLFGVSNTPTYFIVAWGQVFNQLVGGSKDKLEALLKVYNGQPPPPNPGRGNLIDSLFTQTSR